MDALMQSILTAHFPGVGMGPASTASGEVGREPEASLPAGAISRSLPFSEYLRLEGVNWSSLKHMARSPKHYQFERTPPPSETRAMVKGRAAHTAILEPEQYPLEYVVFPGPRRAGKEWDQFETQNMDRTILTRSEDGLAVAMRDAIRGHPVADALLSGGLAEQVIEWVDPETGLLCKARLDYLRPDALVDLKTTADLDPHRFPALVYRMGYHGQLAFYLRGLKALGLDDHPAHLVAVESAAPHDVAAFAVEPGAITVGDELVSRLLDRLAECQATGEWPGRYPGESVLTIPSWAFVEGEELGITINGEAA